MVSRGKFDILDKLIACTAIFCLVLSFSFKPVFGADAPTEGSGGESSSSSSSSSISLGVKFQENENPTQNFLHLP